MIVEISGKPTVENEVLSKLEEKKYRFATFPSIKQGVVSKFPDRNRISMMIAIMKVYKAIKKYNQVKYCNSILIFLHFFAQTKFKVFWVVF